MDELKMEEMKEFILLRTEKKVKILVSREENSAVQCAVLNLVDDIKKVCGCIVELDFDGITIPTEDETMIVIATMEGSWFSKVVPKNHSLYLGKIKEESGKGRWEAFLQQVVGNVFYIIGADRRGTVFGIYDLCEQIGVSPWYYWADVPVKTKECFAFPKDYCKNDWPEVPYRGIFLNDEEELEAWSKLHTNDNTIGPETYVKIFELILRLKGNYIWPAMHVNYFNGNRENGRLAEYMGIVVGTSHCDMLLRSNQNEWEPWIRRKGYQDVRYDYSIPGKNKELICEYWAESVEMNREYEVCYTVGMRGIHDSGFVTKSIDKDQSLTAEEKITQKVRLLEEVISDQRQILKKVLGEDAAAGAPKTFIPYKEVLELYDKGLQVPEDVTLIWVDDNFGYMRRYPMEEEQQRKGGNGLYYHASYWAHPGMSYLFINSIPLAHTGNELKKCWESGIRKIWVLNVGALKPLEVDMEFFLRYAWEAGKETGDTKDANAFTANWINRNFSGDFGHEAAEIYNLFEQLNNVCKVEHMQSDKFSQIAYGNEAKRRLNALQGMADRAGYIYQSIPENERVAFFELYLMKLQVTYYINSSFYYADRSRLFWERGAMQAADEYLDRSRKMDHKKQELLYYYNHVMENGKWNGILTPESFSPPPTVLYPAAKPALVIGNASLGIDCNENLTFYAYGRRQKEVTLFNRGCGSVAFNVEVPSWLAVTEAEGSVMAEKELVFYISEGKRTIVFAEGAEGQVVITGETGERYEIHIQVMKEITIALTKAPFYMEADGYVSIPADGYVENKRSDKAYFRKIPYLGRGRGSAMEAFFETKDHDEASMNETDHCRLQYRFFLDSSGIFPLEIHRFLTLNPTGRVRLAVGVDGGEPILIESETIDEWKGNWREAVMNNGEKLYVTLPWLVTGVHTLEIYPLDSYIMLNRLVIYTKERKENNLGPDDSAFFDGERWSFSEERLGILAEFMQEASSELWERLYGNPTEEELLLPMLYADSNFWKSERLYTRSDERINQLGKAKYGTDENGRKNIFQLFGSGVFEECDGKISIEAEYALENSEHAFLTPDLSDPALRWSHTQAETDGTTGLAMLIEKKGVFWEDPLQAPGMHYRIRVKNSSAYNIWLQMKFEDMDSDSCRIAMDGDVLDISRMYSANGNFFTYSMKQRWHWRVVATLELETGIHTLSILGRKSGLRIDRVYITSNTQLPPVDADWIESIRNEL